MRQACVHAWPAAPCVPCAVVDITEANEGVGLVIAIGEFLAQVQRPLIAADGLLVIAEMVMNVAEAVPGGGLPVAVCYLLDPGQGPLTVCDGLLVVPEQGVAKADVIEDPRLPGPVIRRAIQIEGLQRVAEHVGRALLPLG